MLAQSVLKIFVNNMLNNIKLVNNWNKSQNSYLNTGKRGAQKCGVAQLAFGLSNTEMTSVIRKPRENKKSCTPSEEEVWEHMTWVT